MNKTEKHPYSEKKATQNIGVSSSELIKMLQHYREMYLELDELTHQNSDSKHSVVLKHWKLFREIGKPLICLADIFLKNETVWENGEWDEIAYYDLIIEKGGASAAYEIAADYLEK